MSRFIVGATWDDVPHLTAEAKKNLWASIPPYQRDARAKGIPQLGTGAVYPIAESEFRVAPFEIPKHWRKGYGFDTGWQNTAAVWGALDPEAGVLYIYDCFKRGQAEAPIHAAAVLARGSWIPGVGDAAAINLADGEQFLAIYQRLGLNLDLADKAVEAGIQDVWELLSAGRLKVFATCEPWWNEYRLYHRDERGRIVKAHDHCMDCTRYLVRGRARMKTAPGAKILDGLRLVATRSGGADRWMG